MKECLDEGKLQAFFDGELPPDMMEQAARHVAVCAKCAQAEREVESENAIFSAALDPEMKINVPTEQLRARIATTVAGLNSPESPVLAKSGATGYPWFKSLGELLRFTPQRAAAFASILAVIALGTIFAAVQLRRERSPDDGKRALATPPGTIARAVDVSPRSGDKEAVIADPNRGASSPVETTKSHPRPSHRPVLDLSQNEDEIASVKLMPGERSYIKTIAVLDADLKKNSHRAMTPGTRSEYERNLKLVDYAIAATRSKAKRNPQDPDAAEFMFAAYQSKIDLLSTVSEARLTQH